MFESGVVFGESVHLAHPNGAVPTVPVTVLLPGPGPSTLHRAASAIPAGRQDSAGPGRRLDRTRRSPSPAGGSKPSQRTSPARRSGASGSAHPSTTRLVLPGDPDPALAAARALGISGSPAPIDVDLTLTRCVTTGEARWASQVLHISHWRRAITALPPGPELAAALHHRPEGLNSRPGLRRWAGDGVHWAGAIVDGMVARAGMIASLQAAQYTDAAALARDYPGLREMLGMELSMALHITDAAADALVRTATALTDRLPATLTALAAGRVSDTVARTMVRTTATARPAVAAAVEATVVPDAITHCWTPEQVRRRAARQVVAADPDGAADRHATARGDRHVARWMLPDGMAALKLTAPAQDVTVIWEAATALADAADCPDDDRTLGARRADAITDLAHHVLTDDALAAALTGGTGLPTRQRNRPQVHVTIPYTVLLGGNQPCDLDGHGPITADQARIIAADAVLTRLVCDPISGTLLDYGRTRYEPPDTLRQFVVTRDHTCSFVGCTHPARRGQVDHITPYRPDHPTGGTTSADNLAAPDQHHHRAKDGGGWTQTRLPDGTHQWTSPLGRTGLRPPTRLWEPPTPPVETDRPSAPHEPAPPTSTGPATTPAPATTLAPTTTPAPEPPAEPGDTTNTASTGETHSTATDPDRNNPGNIDLDNNDLDNLDNDDLDNDHYLDFLITQYDPNDTPPDPHDRFPRNNQNSEPAEPPPTTPPPDTPTPDTPTPEPPDDPPPF